MTSYNLQLNSGSILVGSGHASISFLLYISFTTSEISIDSPSTIIGLTVRLELLKSLLSINGSSSNLKIANGILSANTSIINAGASFADIRYNRVVYVPPIISVRPTSRQFSPPSLPLSTVYTLNNRASRFLMASKSGQAKLSLMYENMPDTLAIIFINAYQECEGTLKSIDLSDDFMSGLGSDIKQYISMSGTSIKWHFDAPPSIDFVKSGIVNIKIELAAYPAPGAIAKPWGTTPGTYIPVEFDDITGYQSFPGTNQLPPPPIDSDMPKMWLAYSYLFDTTETFYSSNIWSKAEFDSYGNSYTVSTSDNNLNIFKFTKNGALSWRTTYIKNEDSQYGFNRIPGTDNPPSLVKVSDNLFVAFVYVSLLSYIVVGFTNTGSLVYTQQYYDAPFIANNDPGTNKIIYSSHYDKILYVSFSGPKIIALNPYNGMIVNSVSILDTFYQDGYYLSVFTDKNNRIILHGLGSIYIINSLPQESSTVQVSGKFYSAAYGSGVFGPQRMIALEESAGSYLALHKSMPAIVELDSDLNIVTTKKTQSSIDSLTNLVDIVSAGNGYYYIVGVNAFDTGYSGYTIAKANWSTGYIEYIALVSFAYKMTLNIDPGNQAVHASMNSIGNPYPTSSMFLSRFNLQMLSQLDSVNTGISGGAMSGYTIYNPNKSLTTISNQQAPTTVSRNIYGSVPEISNLLFSGSYTYDGAAWSFVTELE